MPTTEQLLITLTRQVRALMYGRAVVAGRASASADPAVSWAAATPYAAAAGGPSLGVQVGPSGRLAVTATARLTATGGRTLMGWQLVGPYLDSGLATTVTGVTVTTVAADDSRALATASEVTASHRREVTGLAPGWYALDARYAVTGTGGSAQYRHLIAEPV